MYLGRIVAAGQTKDGRAVAMYRVSSRSFPNREARLNNETVSIMPRPGFEDDLSKNPYIAYNCVRMARNSVVASNGSHTDPIVEKIAAGMPTRDALALSLLAMDYEKDDYNTPRIAAVAELNTSNVVLGIVRHDALIIREFHAEPGQIFYVSTYEKNAPSKCNTDEAFDAVDAAASCQYAIDGGVFADFEHPVTSAAAVAGFDGFNMAVLSL
jgi:IMP cyclohydrolase